MATIYLKHPVHGAKVAIDEAEAAFDATNGWVRYDPAVPAVDLFDAAPVNDLALKRKPGRPRKEV